VIVGLSPGRFEADCSTFFKSEFYFFFLIKFKARGDFPVGPGPLVLRATASSATRWHSRPTAPPQRRGLERGESTADEPRHRKWTRELLAGSWRSDWPKFECDVACVCLWSIKNDTSLASLGSQHTTPCACAETRQLCNAYCSYIFHLVNLILELFFVSLAKKWKKSIKI
jgi:hypothetical protein